MNMGISSFANYSVAEIRQAGLSIGPIDHAMQMYTLKDRDLQLSIIQEAERQGCKAIFLTADSPVLGVRYNEWRNDFRTPDGIGFPILGVPTLTTVAASGSRSRSPPPPRPWCWPPP